MPVTSWSNDCNTEYIDVELHLRERTPLGYPATLSIPFLDSFREILPDPPIRELQAVDATALNFGESAAALYGRLLFEWLFVGRLREGFLRSRQLLMDSSSARWRFRVRLPDRTGNWDRDPLFGLRWETLRYQKDGWWLSMETAFARARASSGNLAPVLVNERPIRLFVAATSGGAGGRIPSEPLGEILPAFDHNVARPLGKLVKSNFIHPPLTFSQLQMAYGDAQPHCLVLCGAFDVAAGESAMWFDFGTSSTERVVWRQVVEMACQSTPPELVVLMGPLHGAESAAALAGELHAMGVRAIVQATSPLDNQGFKTFGATFLERLLRSGTIDEAVTFARRALYEVDRQGWGWTAPILSLQTSADAQLFHLLPASVEAELFMLRSTRT